MYLFQILSVVLCGFALPIIMVYISYRQKMNDNKMRTQIVLTALEKNPGIDVEELLKKVTPESKPKLLKEKLLTKLLWGSILTIMGAGFLITQLFDMDHKVLTLFELAGVPLLAVGIALLVNYYVGKKSLVKEMEAEERDMQEKADK